MHDPGVTEADLHQRSDTDLGRRSAHHEAMLDSIDAHVALLDQHGIVVAVNTAWQIFGRENGLASNDAAIGTSYLRVCDGAVGDCVAGASEVADGIRGVLQGRADRFVIEYPCDSPTQQRWFRCYVTPVRGQREGGAVVSHLDITESRRLLERMNRQATALETAANAICITGIDSRLDWVNPAFAQLTGLGVGDRIDVSTLSLTTQSGMHFDDVLHTCHRTGQPWRGETILRRPGGDEVYAQQTTSPIRHPIGNVEHFVTIFEDITDQKRAQRSILYMAEHDQLTGLLNRKSFLEQLSGRLLAQDPHTEKLAVVFLDLDDFKLINDSLGHQAGDLLLTEVAQRLRHRVRSADAVARLGGDEFTLYVDHCHTVDDIRQAVGRVFEAFRDPFDLDGRTVEVSASVGVAVSPDDGRTVDRLVRSADMAMYRMKVQGRKGVQFYDHSFEREASERLSLQCELQHALTTGDFELYLQPQFDLASGHMAGAECLLRTARAGLSSVPTRRLISLAEDSGMIVAVGEWVMTSSIRLARQLASAGIDVPLAINLSPLQFHRHDVCQLLTDQVRGSGLSADMFKLEVTEAVLLDRSQRVRDALYALHAAGFGLCLDDFGTGYASLSYLQQFPLREIKIDGRFVNNIEQQAKDRDIVQGIVRLADSIHLDVVAEGIETQHQYDILRATTCRLGQGYHFGRPTPVDAFVERFAPRG